MKANQWPGLNEKQVIAEMLENSDSEQWEKCSELMRWFILYQANKLSVILSADHVDEILQNAMVSVIIGLPNFRADSKLTTWLTTIAYTRIIDVLRMSTRNNRVITLQNQSNEDEQNEVITYEGEVRKSLEEECITSEELREVLAEISAYIDSRAKPERNRKIAQMVLLEGQTLEEAAREVGVSSAVASYVIRTLRQHLQEKFRPKPSSE